MLRHKLAPIQISLELRESSKRQKVSSQARRVRNDLTISIGVVKGLITAKPMCTEYGIL